MSGERDPTDEPREVSSEPLVGKDGPSFKGRPIIEMWSVESMRRSLKTLTGADGTLRRRVVIALSYLAMFFLGMFAHQSLCSEPSGGPRIGVLAIHSTPAGAKVWINGARLDGEGPGAPVLTPVPAVSNLEYGASYTIRLEMEGYQPWERTVRMGAEVDGRRIEAELVPE